MGWLDFIGAAASIVGSVASNYKENATGMYRNSEGCWYDASCNALETINPILLMSPVWYSFESAESYTDQIVEEELDRFKQEDLPQFYQLAHASGGYNSTVIQNLFDYTKAKTIIKAATLRLETHNKFGTIRTGDVRALADLFGAQKGSYGSIVAGDSSAAGSGIGGILGGVGSIIGALPESILGGIF